MRKSLVTVERGRSATPATGCWRRSASSPRNDWPPPATISEVRDRHAAYFAEQAVAHWDLWDGPGYRDAVDWVDVEFANLRAGFRWAADHADLVTATAIAAHTTMTGCSRCSGSSRSAGPRRSSTPPPPSPTFDSYRRCIRRPACAVTPAGRRSPSSMSTPRSRWRRTRATTRSSTVGRISGEQLPTSSPGGSTAAWRSAPTSRSSPVSPAPSACAGWPGVCPSSGEPRRPEPSPTRGSLAPDRMATPSSSPSRSTPTVGPTPTAIRFGPSTPSAKGSATHATTSSHFLRRSSRGCRPARSCPRGHSPGSRVVRLHPGVVPPVR